MKSIVLTVLILVGIIGLQAQTVESSQPKVYHNQLLIAPFYLFDGTYMLSYEFIFLKSGTFRITPSVTYSNTTNNTAPYNYSERRNGYGIDLGYKAFLIRNSRVVNVYAGPYTYLKYINSNESTFTYEHSMYEGYSYQNNILGFGVDTGVKCTLGHFVIDLTLGGGTRYPISILTIYRNTYEKYKGLELRANLMLGIAF